NLATIARSRTGRRAEEIYSVASAQGGNRAVWTPTPRPTKGDQSVCCQADSPRCDNGWSAAEAAEPENRARPGAARRRKVRRQSSRPRRAPTVHRVQVQSAFSVVLNLCLQLGVRGGLSVNDYFRLQFRPRVLPAAASGNS